MWAPYLASTYGGAGTVGGSSLLTLKYWHYNDVGRALNILTCSDMLLATNEFKYWHFCTNVDPRAMVSIASYEIVHT